MSDMQARIDAVFSEWDKPDSPGCALGVIQDDKLIYARGYGVANLEYDIPITPTSIFHVASVSKQFTAMLIVLLAQQGRLSLADDVRMYLPELPDYSRIITLRHLIHHTSGLRDQWDLLYLAGWREDDVKTNADILNLTIRQQALNFEPGDEFLYCNTGYTLLAVIVERVTGYSLRTYANEALFKPLGMRNSLFRDDHNMIVKNRAYAYTPRDGGGFRMSIPMFDTVGATSFFTTIVDLVKWVRHLNTLYGNDSSLIKQMLIPGTLNNGQKLTYGLGLTLGDYRGLKIAGHSGSDAGFRSHLLWFPEQRFAVVVLCNLSTMNPWKLSRQVSDLYLTKQFTQADDEACYRAAILANETVLKAGEFVGYYRHPETESLRNVYLEDGKLKMAFGPGSTLVPCGNNRFKVLDIPIEINFKLSPINGRFLLQEMDANGKTSIFEAVPAIALTVAELAEYTGIYYSEELDTTYTLALHNDTLMLQRRKFDDRPLRPTFTDEFLIEDWIGMRFLRSEQQHITGFSIFTDRARNLLFKKQEN